MLRLTLSSLLTSNRIYFRLFEKNLENGWKIVAETSTKNLFVF